MKPAIVLLSGGIDSTTTLAIAKTEGFEVYAISFNYGQRHGIELNSAKQCATYFNVQKHLIIKFDLREIGGSALTSDIEIPKSVTRRHGETKKQRDGETEKRGSGETEIKAFSESPRHRVSASGEIPVTYVPARNTVFLSFALAWAEIVGAEDIFIGANAIDYSGYPDCRPEFISAFENMANLATKASVEGTARFKIRAPLINLTKGEIIKKGIELGVDFFLTWSCYDPQELTRDEARGTKHVSSLVPHPSSFTYVPCMRCDSCLLRVKGFREAGIKDPLAIQK